MKKSLFVLHLMILITCVIPSQYYSAGLFNWAGNDVFGNFNNVFVNPAGLNYLVYPQITMTYSQHPLSSYNDAYSINNLSANYIFFGYAQPLGNAGTIEGSLMFNYYKATGHYLSLLFSHTDYSAGQNDWILNIGYGNNITEEISAGINVRLFNGPSWTSSNFIGYAFDLGLLYKTMDNVFSYGIVFQNTGDIPSNSSSYGNAIPFDIRTGMEYKVRETNIDSWIVYGELIYDHVAFLTSNFNSIFNIGIKCSLFEFIGLRAGYEIMNSSDLKNPLTIGIGFNSFNFQLDYAYKSPVNFPYYEYVHKVTLTYKFGSSSKYDIVKAYYEKGLEERALSLARTIKENEKGYNAKSKYIEDFKNEKVAAEKQQRKKEQEKREVTEKAENDAKIQIYLKEGQELFDKEIYDEAVNKYVNILAIDKNNTRAKDMAEIALRGKQGKDLYEQGKLYQDKDEYEKAIEIYMKSLELFPKGSQFIPKINFLIEKAEVDAKKEILFKEGQELFNKEMYEEAVNKYVNILMIDKNDSKAQNMSEISLKGKQGKDLYAQGALCQDKNEYEKAIEIYMKSLELFHKESQFIPKIKILMATCHQKIQNYNEAIDLYDSLISDYPDSEWSKKSIEEKKALGIIKEEGKKKKKLKEDGFIKY